MKDRKVLFFDLDGTILSSRILGIPESTKLAIKKAKENGHLVFVNTGRTMSLVEREIKALNFDGYICGCGSYIEADGKVIYSNKISSEKRKSIIEKIEEYDMDVVLEGINAVYYNKDISTNLILDNCIKNNYPVKTYEEENIEFHKMYVKDIEGPYFNDFYDFIKDTFHFIDHGIGAGEMIPIGNSKATGIDFVLNYFNIDDKNSFAFGDSNNDLDMLKRVSNSIVMGNGNPELFDSATFVTKHIDEDGIEYAMKHFNII